MTDNNKSDSILSFLDELRKQIKNHPVSARQGLKLTKPAEKQFHHLKESSDIPEMFVLVTDVKDGNCHVIPGSFDAMQGGPDDAVLPKSVMGDYVTLAMDLSTDLPSQALGSGFAILDDKTYQRVLDTLESFNGKEPKGTPFSFALPYIGKSDERITYHSRMKSLLEQAKKKNVVQSAFTRHFVISVFPREQMALAAGSGQKDIRLEYAVNDRGLSILVEYSQLDSTFYVNVYNEKGEESNSLDGYQIRMSSSEKILGTIKDGAMTFQWHDDLEACQLFFTDAEGNELPGEWKRG